MFLFDADTSGVSGGTGEPTPNPAATNGDGSDKGKRSFTQDELDTLFAKRADQASQSAVANLLKELGVEKADDIKAALKKAKDLELSQLSDLEKAQKEAADSKAKLEVAEREKAEITAAAAEKLLRAAVLAEAQKQHFYKPDDAWLYIDRAAIKVKEDDTYEGLYKAVAAVLKDREYLADKTPTSPRLGTPRAGERVPGKQPDAPQRSIVRF